MHYTLLLLCIISAIISSIIAVHLRRRIWFCFSLGWLILSSFCYFLVHFTYFDTPALYASNPAVALARNRLIIEISLITTIICYFINKEQSNTGKDQNATRPIKFWEQFRLNLEKRRLRASRKKTPPPKP